MGSFFVSVVERVLLQENEELALARRYDRKEVHGGTWQKVLRSERRLGCR